MSTNCVRCVVNERTDIDLLCDSCRAAGAPSRAGQIVNAAAPLSAESTARFQAMLAVQEVINDGFGGVDKTGRIVDRRKVPEALPLEENSHLGIPRPKSITREGGNRQ